MFDILSSLLQGINDHFGRFVSLFRAILPYSSIVQDSVALEPASAESVLKSIEKTSIPSKTRIYLFQYVKNKGQWEILFLNKECKYLGNIFVQNADTEPYVRLNKSICYKIDKIAIHT